MKRLLAAALLIAPSIQAQARPLAVINGQIIDMVSERPYRATLFIRAGRIERVAPPGTPIPRDADTLDASGTWIIPGLWDMHAHIWDRRLLFPIYVAYGITGVRDMGTTLRGWLGWRDSVSRGLIDGPHGLVAGMIVDGLAPFANSYAQVKSADEGRAIVLDLKARGVDFIKVYDRLTREAYLSIARTARAESLPIAGHLPPSITLLEAIGAGQRSIEHLTSIAPGCSAAGAALAAEAARGLDSVRSLDFTKDSTLRPRVIAALGAYYDKSRSRAFDACDVVRGIPPLARALREGGTWITPTLVLAANSLFDNVQAEDSLRAMLPAWAAGMTRVYSPNAADSVRIRERLDRMLATVRELRRGGVRMLIGSDAPNPGSLPGIGLHRELELFVKAGYSSHEALRIATRDAAEFSGALDSLGTIQAGRLADLVLLGANPLDDITNTRRIRFVLLQGRILRLPHHPAN